MHKLQRALDLFDLHGYLEEQIGDVKQVSGNEYRLNCPFCPAEDPDIKGKFYVNVSEHLFWCHRCHYGAGAGLVQFISDLEGISRSQAVKKILAVEAAGVSEKELKRIFEKEDETIDRKDSLREIRLPKEAFSLFKGSKSKLLKKAERYLLARRLTDRQIKDFDFYFCPTGKYAQRIIIPVIFRKKIRSFVARDLTGKSPVKYRTAPDVDQSRLLFNYDRARKNTDFVVVVEGVFDFYAVDRVGFNCVASFGKNLSDEQLELLQIFKKVVILFDAEIPAMNAARKGARSLQEFGIDARVAFLKSSDPGKAKDEVLIQVIESAKPVNSTSALVSLLEAVRHLT